MIPQGTETRSGLIKLVNNPVKQYAWGYSNSDCYVGRFSNSEKKLSNYAELWMGIHPHGQSEIITTHSSGNRQKQKLSIFVNSINKTLPFLFKVLSIQKCLSIQTHPTKAQALNLHNSNPACYSDPNDKPQMFYTLTKFECFLGYICPEEFERIININIFKQTINKNNDVSTPRQAIIQILNLDQVGQAQLQNACLGCLQVVHPDRYGQAKGKGNIWRILDDFQNDIGIVVSFFLDYRVLQPGQCFYIQCNVPHAYISGQCIEIMKNSDNVCRLGLTPKYKDLSIINQILTNNLEQIPPVSPAMQFEGLQFTQTLYQANSLNLEIVCSKQNKQSQKIERQPQIIIGELEIIRILLILKGQFAIGQENKGNQQQNELQDCQQGTCVLLVPGRRYKIRKIVKKGEKVCDGLFCVGWGDF